MRLQLEVEKMVRSDGWRMDSWMRRVFTAGLLVLSTAGVANAQIGFQ